MLNRVLRITIVVVFAVTGLILTEYLLPYISDYFDYKFYGNGFFGIAFTTIVSGSVGIFVFGSMGMALAPVIIRKMTSWTEKIAILLARVPTSDIMVITFGIAIGLVLANLLGGPFSHLPIIGPYIPLIFSVVLSMVGAKVALRKHQDIVGFFDRSLPSLKGAVKPAAGKDAYGQSIKDILNSAAVKDAYDSDRFYCDNKLLDTSVIIDGRIGDILKTGFLEGFMIVPKFVIRELQTLADSSDGLKRGKGRRGLDLLHEIQMENPERVFVDDTDYPELEGVDAKLVKLAQQKQWIIVTNDFNLNKVAEIQGIDVLNINDLANAVKQMVVPGENINVFLLREGKEAGQAIAYFEDGTMIVVDNGRRFIGSSVMAEVTSVLQTSAGRMVFAKVANR